MRLRALINNYDKTYTDICLNNVVKLSGKKKGLYRDHVWAKKKDNNKAIYGLPVKTVIEFEAEPYTYAKGTKKALKRIKNVKVVDVDHEELKI